MFGDVRKPNCSWVATRTPPARACAPRTSPGALRRTHLHTHEAQCNHLPPSRRAASYDDLPCVRRRCPSSRCGTPAATRGSGGRLRCDPRATSPPPLRRVSGRPFRSSARNRPRPWARPVCVSRSRRRTRPAAGTSASRSRGRHQEAASPSTDSNRPPKTKILNKKDKVMVEVKLERNLDFVTIHNASLAGYGIGSDELGR